MVDAPYHNPSSANCAQFLYGVNEGGSKFLQMGFGPGYRGSALSMAASLTRSPGIRARHPNVDASTEAGAESYRLKLRGNWRQSRMAFTAARQEKHEATNLLQIRGLKEILKLLL